uniref:Dehydrogenase/reductase (SDR family) X-linked n=1 Tax=Neolamprologus brichardi TaxID=32507 RepID=A0A3Q4H4C3_NEOBR
VLILLSAVVFLSWIGWILPKQNGRVAIVTGGTRGIGFETARHLASLGMHVIIAGNEREEGAAAVRKIHEEGTEGTAEFVFVDMTSLKSVRHFVRLFRDRALPLHVLVNNAGTMMVPDRQTEDGFEYHLGLNYLSHFLLTNLFTQTRRCGQIMDRKQNQYSSHGAYSQSKLALVLFTYCLQEQLTASSCCVTVNAVDPGMVDTALYDNLWTLVQLLKKPVAKILFRVSYSSSSAGRFSSVIITLCSCFGDYVSEFQEQDHASFQLEEFLERSKSKSLTGLLKQQFALTDLVTLQRRTAEYFLRAGNPS